MRPRLLDGQSYPVLIQNLWRCLACGLTMEEARERILRHAGLTAFPRPPGNSDSSRTARPSLPVPTVH